MMVLRTYIRSVLLEKRFNQKIIPDSKTGLTFEEMSKSISNTMRRAKLTLTDSPLEKRVYEQKTALKPNGLWYAKGNSWLEWVRTEIPSMLTNAKYVYAIGFDTSKIISVESGRDAQRITYRFKNHAMSTEARVSVIDWGRMANTGKSGIEFIPYEKNFALSDYSMLWYDGIDVPSGCIWDTNILTTAQLVAELKDDGWEVYR